MPFNLIRHLEIDAQHISDRPTINQPRQNRLVIHGDIEYWWVGGREAIDVCARGTLVLESDSLGDLDKNTPARHPILLVYQEFQEDL